MKPVKRPIGIRSSSIASIAFILIAGPASAAITIIEGSSTTSFSDLSNGMAAISSSDYADASQGNGVTAVNTVGTMTAFDDFSVLFNGLGDDTTPGPAPAGAILFNNNEPRALLLVDLQSVVSISAINTFTAHGSTRSHQRYTVYGADDLTGLTTDSTTGWTSIATVNIGENVNFSGYRGVSISDTEGTIGNYQYLLFDLLPRGGTGGGSGDYAFFHEIDVIAVPEPSSFAVLAMGGMALGFLRRR